MKNERTIQALTDIRNAAFKASIPSEFRPKESSTLSKKELIQLIMKIANQELDILKKEQ